MNRMELFKHICVKRYKFFVQMYSESISININGIKQCLVRATLAFNGLKAHSQV